MTGAWTDKARGLVSVIVLEMGGSSDLCATAEAGRAGDPDGPTGTPTEIHRNTTVALVGGGLGNAVLFSIGAATARGRLESHLFRRLQADPRPLQGGRDRARRRRHHLVLRRGARLRADPPADKAFVGNIVQAMAAYGSGLLGEQAVPLRDAST